MAVAAIGLGAALFVMGGAGGAAQAPSGPDAGDPGLELVSLRHERSGSTWTITGLVRNPLSAPAADHLSAVAFLFDDSGAFVASGRSPVEFEKLGPGDESPFVIRVEAPGRVARYRVSFRASDGGMVKHVDRRNDPQGPPRS